MVSPNIGSTGVHVLTTRECLVELNKLVPKSVDSISQLTQQERAALQGMIADLLQKVFSNDKSFAFGERSNLMNIRDLAQKAEEMHLLSEPAKAAIKGIAAKTKEIGLSLYTAPRDFTLHTTDGDLKVNFDLLKENGGYFKSMAEVLSEQKESPIDFPKKTVEFLMELLHAPETKPIELPNDTVMVMDLIRCAHQFEFDTLIKKLEPAVTHFLTQYPDTIVKNGESCLSALYLVNQSHPETATKWLDVITPHFLENFGIPVKPSALPERFEIPIEHLHVLFDEQTRDLLKYLPLVLNIKDEQELDHFKQTIQTTKLESLLPIKLLWLFDVSTVEEESIKTMAKASNIQLILEKNVLPPGTVFFGKELWDTYLGEVDDVPLPAGIGTLLASPCPAFPGHTWKDKFMLVLMPKTVDGAPLTLNSFRELAQDPRGEGHAANYRETRAAILEDHGNKAVERSEWVLMSMDVLKGSRGLRYAKQEAMVAAIPRCEVPDLLSAHVGILTHFIHTGERLYGKDTYTRCKETNETGRCQALVGDFHEGGLTVFYGNPFHPVFGVGALRKFVS